MAQFAVHKKGFFYTDEAYEATESVGKLVKVFDNYEDAIVEKKVADIKSMQKLKGQNVVDFFFDNPNYDKVFKELEAYYQSEFNLSIEDKYYFDFPSKMNIAQAEKFLAILGVSFHDIVEYSDDIVLKKKDFNLEDEDLCEF